jgi:hypothetical protein
MDSRALNLEATTAVEMPVPAITGLPNPTAGLIWISQGLFCVLSMTNGVDLGGFEKEAGLGRAWLQPCQ